MDQPSDKNDAGDPKAPGRNYDNSARSARSETNRFRILEALANLMHEAPDQDVTFDQIAARSGLSVRTVFRFFPDKESLFRTFEAEVLRRLSDSHREFCDFEPPEFAAEMYRLFERHAPWVSALTVLPSYTDRRQAYRQEIHALLRAKILQRTGGEVTPQRERQMVLITGMVSAPTWRHIRKISGFGGHDMADAVAEAVRTLVTAGVGSTESAKLSQNS